MCKKWLYLLVFFVISANSQAFTPSSLQEMKSQETLTLKSHHTFLFFWATWCTSCKTKLKEDLPLLQKKSGFDVVAVNIDKNIRRAQHYIQKNDIAIPIYRVKEGISNNVIEQLNVRTSPQWALYEKNGNSWKLKEHKKTFDKDEVKNALSQNKKEDKK